MPISPSSHLLAAAVPILHEMSLLHTKSEVKITTVAAILGDPKLMRRILFPHFIRLVIQNGIFLTQM